MESSYSAIHSGDSTITAVSINNGKAIVTLKAGETFTILNLPTETSYEIKEDDYSNDGYTPSATGGTWTGTIDNSTVTVTCTNTYNVVDLKVIKIDQESRTKLTQTTLPNAKFKLYRQTNPLASTEFEQYTVYPDPTNCEKTTDDKGELSFTGLPNGQYMLKETKSPNGYVRDSDVKIYFKVEANSTLTWTDASGTAKDPQNAVDNLVGYIPDSKTYVVGNKAGAQLPATGGPGTIIFYLSGLLLTTLSAITLLLKRRSY